ncbi:PQQ-binding-like beta-propeller repeat protein [Haladaptatus pallidirubidus]|uniref:Pyrrolo-quinoline quinone repeat domain-containing protein n=1 Tax=Haladaptatus pallidirubidus TaxID=1008152 RepID=A0AAV3UI77_9EURY|nr:PQQ-binding-like beta-propeller repeat protein [Haladaptatus pallidirubidus]
MVDKSHASSIRNTRRTFLKTVGVAVSVASCDSAIAASRDSDSDHDWKQSNSWAGLRATPGRTAAITDNGPTPYAKTDWKMDLGGSMYNTEPIVVDETAYLAVSTANDPSKSEGFVGAYNSKTGNQRWKRADLPAPRTPVVSDGRIYFATKIPSTPDADRGGLYALDAENGKIEWNRTVVQEWAAPIVTEQRVYTSNENGAYALNRTTGETIWKTDGVGGIADGVGGALSYSDSTIFFGDGTALNAENGSMKWCIDHDQFTLGNHAATDDMVYYIRTERVVGDDDSVSVTARSIDDGTTQWAYESNMSNEWDGRLAIAGGHVVLLNTNDEDSIIKALDAETGAVVWTQRVNGTYFSSPTIANETIYVGGRSVPGSNRWDGQAVIYAIDLQTGEQKWAYLLDSTDLETSPENPPAAGTPVVADGKLYTATYPSGSTLAYRYIYYSNFFVLESYPTLPDS